MIEKLAKLLALAENASTEEEAQAFMSKAQLLSTKYSIELATARAAIEKSQRREAPEVRRTQIADTKSKTKKHMVNLYNAVARVNDVRIDISGDSTTVISHGFPTDIDVTDAMFFSLSRQMVEQANAWLDTGEYKKEIVNVWSESQWRYVDKPVDKRVARGTFYQNFIWEVSKRLKAAKASALEQFEQETGTGTELVLMDKTQEVHDYYRNTSMARGSWSGPSSSGYSHGAGQAGQKAGSSAKLSGDKAMTGGKKAIGV